MEDKDSSQMTPLELRSRVEAVLFASGKKIDVYFIKDILGVDNVRKIKNALESLKKWYDENNKVLMINQEGDLWKMNVRESYSDVVRKLISETDLPRAVLETLSVIAWKSPVYQSEIVNIRGAGAYDHISMLVDTSFVTKEKQGRSYILKVTNKFFEYFDIEGNEGIKEVFKKIKDQPGQKKVEEFNESDESGEEADLKPEEDSEDKEEIKNVGEFPVVDIEEDKENPESDSIDEAEKLGKLEVFENENNQYDEDDSSSKIFDENEFNEDEEPEPKSINSSQEDLQSEEIPEDSDKARTKKIVEELLDDEGSEDPKGDS